MNVFTILAMVYGLNLSPLDEMNAGLASLCYDPRLQTAFSCEPVSLKGAARLAWAIIRQR